MFKIVINSFHFKAIVERSIKKFRLKSRGVASVEKDSAYHFNIRVINRIESKLRRNFKIKGYALTSSKVGSLLVL